MAAEVNPGFINEIKKYGEVKIEECFNCGNCTAICSLSTENHPFPRTNIRLLQLGLEDRLLENVDPWLCYYCGECTETCPKGAEPAEAMMTMRRWLIAQYDRSGHGEKLYTSTKASIVAILSYAMIPVILLLVGHLLSALGVPGFEGLAIVTDRVSLNAFAPTLWVWIVVLIDFGILSYRLFSNIGHMYQKVMRPGENKIPALIYFREIKTFFTHVITQRRWRDCDGDDHSRWFKHLALVSSYGIMLVLIVGMLWWFQTDQIYPIYHPQRWLGYYATAVLLYTSGESLLGRLKKKEELHKYSHHSDWMFPAFLFVGTLTGILVHVLRYAALPWPTYIMYVVHVMVMIAMLDTEVGIGKWTHIFYRPLAIYFDAVKVSAEKYQEIESPATSPAITS